MAVKRRTIWMTDEEWNAAQDYAAEMGLTSSALIRHALDKVREPKDDIDRAIATVNQQAERDAILRRIKT